MAYNQTQTQANKTADNAQDTLNSAKDTFNAAKNDFRDAASDKVENFRDKAEWAGRRVRDYVGSATDEISHYSDVAANSIRSNPVQSTLIALGAGFLIGLLTSSSRR